MFISRHTLKWTKTCRSSGDFPHAHTAHFLLNRHSGKVMAVVLAAALAWGGFAMLTAEPARSDTGATQVISYIVRPGDTLWSYASSITPAGQDVSETVDELISLNNLESGALRAGQRLIVPAE